MNPLLLLADPESGGQIEQIARTFGVDWPHLTAQMISFAIVCAMLYWLAYQPVLRMLEERRKQIAMGVANTEKINAALADLDGSLFVGLHMGWYELPALVAAMRTAAQSD
jgi:lauroyl/myristoyl acyltransferase